ncbi:MAG: PAS domain-containing protein, partial [Rhodothermales bacterium]|nr:PAS domain-containing protein [Rhodothermales bacterium]
MGDSPEPFGPLEPALLVASCAPDGGIVFANEAWRRFFGGDAAWDALAPEDREQAVRCVEEAGGGHLVTHQIFPVRVGDRDEPVPVLLHFYPVYGAEAPTEVCAV